MKYIGISSCKLVIVYLLSSFIAILAAIAGTFIGNIIYHSAETIITFFSMVTIISFTLFSNKICKKEYGDLYFKINIYYILVCTVIFSLLFYEAQASILAPSMSIGYALVFPLLPLSFIFSLFANTYSMIVCIGIVLLYSLLYSLWKLKNIKLMPTSIIFAVCAICCVFTYLNSPNYKYKNQNHNFEYMMGYSSVDLYDYALYNPNNKLVTVEHGYELIDSYMPVLDGAEACFPVYSAIAKALYKDIENMEYNYYKSTNDENGRIVTFYNTAIGFERLLEGQVDMFFGAKPSNSQLELAKSMNIELEYTAIGKEGFVFFVNEDNPITSLTTQQIKDIYSGKITNWKEVGGKNEKIIAFQRPERSGSQSMMVYFMGDTKLKEPLTYEMEYAMLGIIKQVVEYHNEAGAIGYSFRYYFDGMTEVEGAKMIAVDGVYPTTETIKSGEYPLVTSLYCITDKANTNENVDKVLDFMLNEEGQKIIEETGYVSLK